MSYSIYINCDRNIWLISTVFILCFLTWPFFSPCSFAVLAYVLGVLLLYSYLPLMSMFRKWRLDTFLGNLRHFIFNLQPKVNWLFAIRRTLECFTLKVLPNFMLLLLNFHFAAIKTPQIRHFSILLFLKGKFA